jgi:hypothetical protein
LPREGRGFATYPGNEHEVELPDELAVLDKGAWCQSLGGLEATGEGITYDFFLFLETEVGVRVRQEVALVVAVVGIAGVFLLVRHLDYRFQVEPLALVLNDFRWWANKYQTSALAPPDPRTHNYQMARRGDCQGGSLIADKAEIIAPVAGNGEAKSTKVCRALRCASLRFASPVCSVAPETPTRHRIMVVWNPLNSPIAHVRPGHQVPRPVA